MVEYKLGILKQNEFFDRSIAPICGWGPNIVKQNELMYPYCTILIVAQYARLELGDLITIPRHQDK